MKALTRAGQFVTEVREELQKVSWPNREELTGSAVVVFVGVALLAGFITVCDFVWSQAATWLLR